MRGRRPVGIANGELRRMFRKTLELRDRAQLREGGWEFVCQQTQGHGLARTDHQAHLPVEVHLAVPSETAGAHVDRFDHRSPGADQRALGANHRSAAGNHRDVGGGAAHVGDHEILEAGEKARSDNARRRPRQYGLDRVLERDLGPHQ